MGRPGKSIAFVLVTFAALPVVASLHGAEASGGAPSVTALKALSLEELMDIEVTSVSKRPEKLADAASAIQVITQDDIHRAGVANIPEALRLAGNLDVAEQNSHAWKISARGFNTDLANKLLVLIDGRTVYTPLFSGVYWDLQDYLLEDVDRIEVVSGPGGTLWGANAVNGVINITTKSAGETQGSYVQVGGGTDLRSSVAVRHGGTLAPNVYYRVYAAYSDWGSGVLRNDADARNSWHMSRAGFRVDANPRPADHLTLQGDYYEGDENQQSGGAARVSGGNVLGRWARTLSPDSELKLQLYYDRTHQAVPKPATGSLPAGWLVDDLDTYDLDFQHHFSRAARHRVVWGAGFRFMRDTVGNAPTIQLLPARLDRHLASAFAQDEIALRDDLFLTLGTKLEHNDYTGFEWEPNVRLRWTASATQTFWAAVSRAVRTPSRVDRDLRQPTGLPAPLPQSILTGGSDFSSESVMAYEVGHRAQLGAKATTAVSLFYNVYDDVRSLTPGPAGFPSFGFPLVFHNNLEGETHGAELTVTCEVLPGWRLHGTYDLLEEHLRVKPGQVDFSQARNETADPRHQFALRSSLDLPREASLDAAVRWVDTLHNNNGPTPGTVPAYAELDVALGWRPTPAIELTLVGQNLLHSHHPEYGFPGAAREEIQRGVRGKITWRF